MAREPGRSSLDSDVHQGQDSESKHWGLNLTITFSENMFAVQTIFETHTHTQLSSVLASPHLEKFLRTNGWEHII